MLTPQERHEESPEYHDPIRRPARLLLRRLSQIMPPAQFARFQKPRLFVTVRAWLRGCLGLGLLAGSWVESSSWRLAEVEFVALAMCPEANLPGMSARPRQLTHGHGCRSVLKYQIFRVGLVSGHRKIQCCRSDDERLLLPACCGCHSLQPNHIVAQSSG